MHASLSKSLYLELRLYSACSQSAPAKSRAVAAICLRRVWGIFAVQACEQTLRVAASLDMAVAAAAGVMSPGNTTGMASADAELVQRNLRVVITEIGENALKNDSETGVLRLAGQSVTTLPSNLQQLRELYAAANRQDIIAACRCASSSESGDLDGVTCNKESYDLPISNLAALQAVADW